MRNAAVGADEARILSEQSSQLTVGIPSEEELAAEKSIKEYNEMVEALKAQDEEYAKLYNEVVSYLQKETLTDKERKAFLEKYEKMLSIQKKYKETHKSEDVSGNA